MADIQIDNLHKSYCSQDNGLSRSVVLKDINLSIKSGEFVTFFGPNGCGKTTFLKVLAGIEPYDDGTILIDSKGPIEAKTGLVFQDYSDSLMPWLTCRENILFPFSLKNRKSYLDNAKQRLDQLLKDLKIDLPFDNYGYQLSGGQQQLTAILRTLLYQPDVILMDEPFSALDYQTRRYMHRILLEVWERDRPTILFVSHDLEEALYLADRLVLLSALPASVTDIHDIHFGRPRLPELLETQEFFQMKRDCLRIFHKEVQ